MERLRPSRPLTLTGPQRVPKSIRVPDGINRQMYDTLQNLITGLGTGRDKLTGTQFVFSEMGKQETEMAYRSDWISRKVVDIPAQDATREWRTWQSDKEDIGNIENVEKTLFLQRKVRLAMQKARLYGGAALLMGVNQGKLDQPLDPTKVKKDDLKFVHVVSRYELSGGEMEWDIDSPYYGQPKYYRRAQQGGSITPADQIHPSRVVRFLGNEVPDPTVSQGWGDSVLQVVRDAVLAAGIVVSGGAQILNEIKMDVIKIPNLSASLANEEYAKRLNDRFGFANIAKSLYNILLLDTEEEWERITTNIAGIPDYLRMYLLVASGAADIPATRMLGQSPAGLSATGESDMRNYYDHVKSEQKTTQQPAMTVLDEVLIRSALGTANPQDITYDWNPLWQMDEQTKSTIIGQKATAYQTDVNAGQIPPEVLRDARINQLIEDGVYPGLEQILDDYGPLEDIEEPPEPGAVIGPDGKPISPSDPNHPANQQEIDPKTGKPTGNTNVVPFQKQVAKKTGLDAMAGRVRRAKTKSKRWKYSDGTARTLYVYRKVLNADAVIAWAKDQGIPDLYAASDLHVTICYSRTPVDWMKAGEAYDQKEDGTLTIPKGGVRMVDKFGNCIVLCFNSSALTWRHCQIKDNTGATWDYNDYQPHITVSDTDQPVDFLKMQGFTGPIELGPEIFETANGNYSADDNGNPVQKRAS